MEAVEESMMWTGEVQAAEQSKLARHLRTPKSRLGLKLIVVADVFETLAVIEARLQPLFQVYAAAKVLVIGHPTRVANTATGGQVSNGSAVHIYLYS